MKFSTPDLSDKRVLFAASYLEEKGLRRVSKSEYADFILLGVNPDKKYLLSDKPIFAGNVDKEGVTDYTKLESFALKNAYLTAEGAIALAIQSSGKSLINSAVLITGYGRIAKALHLYLTPFTKNITVCARDKNAKTVAEINGAKTLGFHDLKQSHDFDFIFNTVPYPVFNEEELSQVKKGAIILDLASFPGGVDKNCAKIEGVKLVIARGLPSLFSPETAGKVVGEKVYNIIEEGKI